MRRFRVPAPHSSCSRASRCQPRRTTGPRAQATWILASYDVVHHVLVRCRRSVATISYVRRTMSYIRSHVRHRTCDVRAIDSDIQPAGNFSQSNGHCEMRASLPRAPGARPGREETSSGIPRNWNFHVYTRYMPGIYTCGIYTWHIPGFYMVYLSVKYIPGIPGIYIFM